MFKLTFKAPRIKIMKDAYLEALRIRLQAQLREAAKEFVAEAIQRVPMDTGQARGTFLPLSRFLGMSVEVGGVGKKRKNSETGASEGKQLIFKFKSTARTESFEIDPQLVYFIINDFHEMNYPNGQAPTPWESLETGWQAFMTYIHEVAPLRFPDIGAFIEIERRSDNV